MLLLEASKIFLKSSLFAGMELTIDYGDVTAAAALTSRKRAVKTLVIRMDPCKYNDNDIFELELLIAAAQEFYANTKMRIENLCDPPITEMDFYNASRAQVMFLRWATVNQTDSASLKIINVEIDRKNVEVRRALQRRERRCIYNREYGQRKPKKALLDTTLRELRAASKQSVAST